MRSRLSVVVDEKRHDVAVDVDPSTTVGELADALVARVTSSGSDAAVHGLTVETVGSPPRLVSSTATIEVAGIRSGDTVRPSTTSLAGVDPATIATLTVHTGPDAPARIPLHDGWNSIGRSGDCDVRLSDPSVSARHARAFVGDRIEIVDEASSNGVVVDGERVANAEVGPGNRCVLGDTSVSFRRRPTADMPAPGGEVPFNRSPRVGAQFEGLRLTVPQPPRPPTPFRFPLATVLAPLVLAAILFAFTRSLLSVLFFALSPLLMVASWWETRAANRRQVATENARFRSALADLDTRVAYAHDLERFERCREHPGVVEVLEAVDDLAPLVWTRRPEHDGFARVRLGLASQASRTTVESPPAGDALAGLSSELRLAVEGAVVVADVPVVADLRASGNLGIAGPPETAAAVARGVLVQLVGLHAPDELRCAAFASGAAWDWLKWAPHVDETWLARDLGAAELLVSELDRILDERDVPCSDGAAVLPTIVVVVDDDAPVDRSRLIRLAEDGPSVGIHVVWMASTVERLPAACRTFVEVAPVAGRGTVGVVTEHRSVERVTLEPVGEAAAERLSRTLSPLVDAAGRAGSRTDTAADVAIVDLLGDDVAQAPAAVAARWRDAEPCRGLSAVVGVTDAGPMTLDLRGHGPHAIVGGTTGSGKSEFLQTWILALAADHAPSRVTFLLVDYKGGAAFGECVELPHCVGLVTDLRPHLVRRALTSLHAELRHREQLLHDRRAKDVLELESRGDPHAPPSLVVVVDEFAALAADVPEFVDGMINLAQRGRSLGLHLVLATQRPAGVVTDNLRANANLRIALRMADAGDSVDVIGTPCAADFERAAPGRAIAAFGSDRRTQFQGAYVGGRAAGRDRRVPIVVSSLPPGPSHRTGAVPGPTPEVGPSDLVRIVGVIRAAASMLGCPPPRRPWLPELADQYCLEALPTARRDDELVFGVGDQPDQQAQPTVAFRPDVDGNMAIYGTGGTGKSTVLRSIAVSAAFGMARGGDVWVYALDLGGGALRPLEPLPHVGAVVAGDDDERVRRLLDFLSAELGDRAERFAAGGASTIVEYRRETGERLARIVLLVDGFGALRDAYEGGHRHSRWEQFARIVADGRSVGIHVVMTADRPAALPSSVAASVQRELVLRLAGDLDAIPAEGATRLGDDAPPGRGTFHGLDVQIAVLGGDASAASQSAAIRRCVVAAATVDALPAPPIRTLPARVALSDLRSIPGRAVIGVDDDTLQPVGVAIEGGFLVAGGPGSGVSTTVATVILAIRRCEPATEFVLLGRRRSALADCVDWAITAFGPDAVAALAQRLSDRIDGAVTAPITVVVEAIDQLLETPAELPVHDLLRVSSDHGVFVVADGETSRLTGSWPLLQAVRAYRCGVALQPDQIEGEALFNAPFPRTERREYPIGRGLLVQDGAVSKVQVAVPE